MTAQSLIRTLLLLAPLAGFGLGVGISLPQWAPNPLSTPEIHQVSVYYNDSSADNLVVFDRQTLGGLSQLAIDYAMFFQARIINSFSSTFSRTWNTLVLIVHGGHRDNGTYFQFDSQDYVVNDLPAKKAILISCNIDRLRLSDNDTEIFGYAEAEMNDTQEYYTFIENNLVGWGTYFLSYLKLGWEWRHAEAQARLDTAWLRNTTNGGL